MLRTHRACSDAYDLKELQCRGATRRVARDDAAYFGHHEPGLDDASGSRAPRAAEPCASSHHGLVMRSLGHLKPTYP